MEEKILKRTAVFIMTLSVVFCLGVFHFPRLRTVSEELIASIKERRTKTEAERLDMTELELMAYNNKQAEEETGKKPSFTGQIRLELPRGVLGSDLKINSDYLRQKIEIRIPYAGESYLYEYPMLGSGENVESLTYQKQENYGVLEFIMSQVYEPQVSYDDDYYYLDFLEPQELYDKVIVIDAGGGGDDSGVVKQGILEKNVNLDIVLQLKEIFDASPDENIGVYYTRTTDENPNRKLRKTLIDKTNADLFIGVYANATQSGRMSSIHGTQVWYGETESEMGMGSKDLAQICLEEITAATGSSNKGLMKEKDDSVISGSRASAVLIKVGFMTNQQELDLLCTKEYQYKAAQGIYHAIKRFFKEKG